MSPIDPAAVRGFVAGIENAKGFGQGALDSIRRLQSPGASVDDVVGARIDIEFLADSLSNARLETTTHAAAFAAGEVLTGGASDVRRTLAELHRSIAEAGGALDGREVVIHASNAQRQLNKLVSWELDNVAQKATAPMAYEDATLGAMTTDGAWKSFDDAANSALLDVQRSHHQQVQSLVDEIDEIGLHVDADEPGTVATMVHRHDDDIAIDDAIRTLENTDDIAGAIARTSAFRGSRGPAADASTELMPIVGPRAPLPLDTPVATITHSLGGRRTPGVGSVQHAGAIRVQGARADGLAALATFSGLTEPGSVAALVRLDSGSFGVVKVAVPTLTAQQIRAFTDASGTTAIRGAAGIDLEAVAIAGNRGITTFDAKTGDRLSLPPLQQSDEGFYFG